MKSIIFFILCISCIFSQAQVIKTKCTVPANSSLLNYKELETYVNKYHTFHSGSAGNHTKAMYFNNATILFLDSFFNNVTNSKYYGVSIYLLNYNDQNHPGQRFASQTRVYIVPIYNNPLSPQRDSTSDYEALEKFYSTVSSVPEFSKRENIDNARICYNNCDSSVLKWSYHIQPNDPQMMRLNSANIDQQPYPNERALLTKDASTNYTYRENYRMGQGVELNESQTKRVYYTKESFQRLAYFIKSGNNASLYPMVGLYFISYGKRLVNQLDPNQTSVAFVPMLRMRSGNLEPDPCAYVEFYKAEIKKKSSLFILAENHGELCPKNCPPEGN